MITTILLKVNCGYAIREITLTSKTKHRGIVHKQERQAEFNKLFDTPTYKLIYRTTKYVSMFDKHCGTVYNFFNKKWHPTSKRVEYTNTFCITNWSSDEKEKHEKEKHKHTLSECKACYLKHQSLQEHFPGRQVYLADKPPLPNILPKEVVRKNEGNWEGKY